MAKKVTTGIRNDLRLAEVPRLSLRAPEAAAALGISARKLWELTKCGEVPHVKLGSSVLYPIDGLRVWLSRNLKDVG